VATLDLDPFYSFTDTRPRVRVSGSGERTIRWPRAEWHVARMSDDAEHDLVLFRAPEPNLRWRTYTAVLLDVLQQLGTEMLVSFGAVLAPVHHRAQPSLRGWATTDTLRADLRRRQIRSGRYEGPTGITTALLIAAKERGLPAFSLSTSSPSYLTELPNPLASVALLRGFSDIASVSLPLADLERDGWALADQVDRFLADRPEVREEVDRLPHDAEPPAADDEPAEEQGPPPELPTSADVLNELEAFLKTLRQDEGDKPDER
jgi:predicted ATP-grasp superfamily ATP-dependent carboligase